MAQTSYDLKIDDPNVAKELVTATSNITGVKWVNVNRDKGTVVVTHSDDFDEAKFKSLAGL